VYVPTESATYHTGNTILPVELFTGIPLCTDHSKKQILVPLV